jgi:hypothetical protein
MSAYFKKKSQKSQINNLMMHLKLLEKQEKAKPQISKWQEIIKIRVDMKEMKLKEQYKKSTKQRVSSLER